MNGCKSNEIIIDDNLLTRYNAIAIPIDISEPSKNIDCYLDYSWGMGPGMSLTSDFNGHLKDFLLGKTHYFKVGADQIPPEIDINSKQADFTVIDNFQEPGSKLRGVVDKIIADKNKTSIFITDFELVQNKDDKKLYAAPCPAPHPIDPSAWAKVDFIEWLKAGNQIDIFARKYSKPDYWFDKSHTKQYENWIYTLVFTPNSVVEDENIYKTSVLKFLNDQYEVANGSDSKHFSYSVNNYKIDQEKKDETIGDANDNLVAQNLVTNTFAKGFEYYEFESKDLVNFNTDNSLKDKRIINKIKIASKNDCFSNVQFGIKSYDVTESISNFFTSMNQEAPEVDTNAETGAKDTLKNKPIKYNYSKGQEVKDVFDFVYNIDNNEIGIKLKPDFTGVPQNTIYQVDVVVSSVKLKDFTESDSVLKLNYAQGYTIRSLGESVKFALNDVEANINNKIIYTVYIKIDK